MSSILPLKRPTDYFYQGRTGSQYYKNAQVTVLSQQILALPEEICKWLCEFGGTSLSIYLCHQKHNPARVAVPLIQEKLKFVLLYFCLQRRLYLLMARLMPRIFRHFESGAGTPPPTLSQSSPPPPPPPPPPPGESSSSARFPSRESSNRSRLLRPPGPPPLLQGVRSGVCCCCCAPADCLLSRRLLRRLKSRQLLAAATSSSVLLFASSSVSPPPPPPRSFTSGRTSFRNDSRRLRWCEPGIRLFFREELAAAAGS
jgi:hypothetical protein